MQPPVSAWENRPSPGRTWSAAPRPRLP